MKRLVAVAGMLVLGCRSSAIPDSQVFPAGTPFRARALVVDSTRLRIIDTGRGPAGPAVVFIHGLGASMYSWRHQLEPVLAAGYRVIAFDNRGFGFSDRPARGYSNADYARLVVALLDSLGVDDAVLVGHSMGAAIAAEVALTHPDRARGLVLIGPAGYGIAVKARSPLLTTLKTLFLSREGVRATLRSMFADSNRVTEADVDQYYAPLAAPGAGATLRRVIGSFRFDALRGRLRSLQVPTLVLWGQGDAVIPFAAAAGLAQELPRAAFIVVPNAGHNVQEEQPDAVNRSLIAFLQHGLPATPPDLAAGRSNATRRSTPSRTRAG